MANLTLEEREKLKSDWQALKTKNEDAQLDQEDNFVKGIIKFAKTRKSKYLMPIFDYCMVIKKEKEDDPEFLNRLPRDKRQQMNEACYLGDLNSIISGLLEKTYIKKAKKFDDPFMQSQCMHEYTRVENLLRKIQRSSFLR